MLNANVKEPQKSLNVRNKKQLQWKKLKIIIISILGSQTIMISHRASSNGY